MPKKSRLNLGKYVVPKRKDGRLIGYYFNLPSVYSKIDADDPRGPCPVRTTALGLDADAARAAGAELLVRLEAWRRYQAPTAEPVVTAAPGTFNWMVRIFKESPKFKKLDAGTRKNHDNNLLLVARYPLKSGGTLGGQPLSRIAPDAVDKIYEKLLVREDGTERRTSINNAMRSCRRAWNVARRAKPELVPAANPFSRMGLEDRYEETTPATFEQYQMFRKAAVENGRKSLAIGALIAWEWQQREADIFGRFVRSHYRPPARPDMSKVVHYKNKERKEVWQPLFDPQTGAALYPELQAELDAIAEGLDVGHMLLRDWEDQAAGRRLPWPARKGGLDYMRKEVRRICDLAGLPPEITFASFRHGGYTEGGDAELTDSEFRATSGKDASTLPVYVHRTTRQIASAQAKRRAVREQK
jgi:hypothetical protein